MTPDANNGLAADVGAIAAASKKHTEIDNTDESPRHTDGYSSDCPLRMQGDRHWLLRGGKTLCVSSCCLMGIVNITPDSFYDGGAHDTPESAVRHSLRLLEQGARILDLGAQSSRPGAKDLAPEEEQARLLPVLRALREKPPGRETLLSVDTYRASTARLALEAGADIINDI
ncbi:MAG: dihydropteroate synthase, partial [Deltaproteobacteria bacterium]|nr:dihydropteroate synthase [Deltaproteobacteria bacterium]